MTHRPYPSPVRARHQLDRSVHVRPPVLTVTPTAMQFVAAVKRAFPPNFESGMANLRAAFAVAPKAHGLRLAAPSDPGSSA